MSLAGRRVVLCKSDWHLSQATLKIPKDAAPSRKELRTLKMLFKANAAQLPKDNTRPPRVTVSTGLTRCVRTTDFFGFDTSDNQGAAGDESSQRAFVAWRIV